MNGGIQVFRVGGTVWRVHSDIIKVKQQRFSYLTSQEFLHEALESDVDVDSPLSWGSTSTCQ